MHVYKSVGVRMIEPAERAVGGHGLEVKSFDTGSGHWVRCLL